MKRFLIQLLLGILISVVVAFFYLVSPSWYKTIDNTLRDAMFLLRGPIETTGSVVVVDIDEKSLREVGQWPWPRDKVAVMLQKLHQNGAAMVGLDIVFAEKDNTSPARILSEYGYPTEGAPDHDEILARTIAATPTIPGYVFKIGENVEDNADGRHPLPPAKIRYFEKHTSFVDDYSDMLEPQGVTLNLPVIQDNAYSSGYFNNIPDPSGIIRSVPLIMRYEGNMYPSLALEMIRLGYGYNTMFVNYDVDSINGIESLPNHPSGHLFIPTDRLGRMMINFRGPAKTFEYISATDVYHDRVDPAKLAGKIVLVGTSAAGLLDLRSIPYDNIYPGVEVHANIIDNILRGDFISKPAAIQLYDLVLILTVGITLAVILTFTGAFLSLLLMLLYMGGLFAFNYYMLFEVGYLFDILSVNVLLVLSIYIVSVVLNYFLETRQKNMIKGKFASKVSPAVMEEILKHADENVLAEDEREITVFFSDVRNFTNISEAMGDPKALIEFMNEYMDPMTEIIVKSGGTVDKFIGDAIMAYWNAPQEIPDHPDRALRATMDQLHALKPLNEQLRKDPRFANVVKMSDETGKPIVDIGIGLNTGVAIVGEMGSTGRSDYTVIGDPINLGSRLESLCKFYNSQCNISSFTKERLTGEYIYRFLDLVTVKGKHEPVEIWQVIDYEHPPTGETLYTVSRERLQDELDRHHHGVELYKNSRFDEALEVFKELEAREDKTNQAVYKLYIERCQHYIEEPPKDFNGVFVHTSKG